MIFIPSHLRNIEVIEQLYQLITSYSEQYEESSSSFDSYDEYKSSDPVKTFLHLIYSIKEKAIVNNKYKLTDKNGSILYIDSKYLYDEAEKTINGKVTKISSGTNNSGVDEEDEEFYIEIYDNSGNIIKSGTYYYYYKYKYISEGEDIDSVINYVSSLFYSTKGSDKTFDLLKKYVRIFSYSYTPDYVEIVFPEDYDFGTTDYALFDELFGNFLNSIIYFKNLRTNSNPVSLHLTSGFKYVINSGVVCFKKFSPEELTI